jgi:hypothetical protein
VRLAVSLKPDTTGTNVEPLLGSVRFSRTWIRPEPTALSQKPRYGNAKAVNVVPDAISTH